MSGIHFSPAASRAAFLASMMNLAAVIAGCGGGSDGDAPASDWTPFIQLAREQSACADIRHRLFVIDQTVVLIDRVGNCPDGSYSQVLYGDTVDDVLCDLHDSIAGPVKNCPVPAYTDMFEIIVTHLSDPDLGLGSTHEVVQLPLT